MIIPDNEKAALTYLSAAFVMSVITGVLHVFRR